MWKNYTATCLAVVIYISAANAQPMRTREDWGMRGFVKSVTERTAEIVFKNGKPAEKGKELDSVQTFSISGQTLTNYVYTDGGEILYGDTLKYDPQGRLMEMITEHSKFVYLCDKSVYL